MALTSRERSILADGSQSLRLALDGERIERLGLYLDLLDTWRRRINLVSAPDRETLLTRHIIDSLAPAHLIAGVENARLIDVGSGAGLPGLPLSIALPQTRVTLLEPRAKRVSFLRTAVRDCFTWNVEVLADRLEHVPADPTRSFDFVLSRATFAPAGLPARVKPLLAPGARLVAFASSRQEIPSEPPAGFEAPSFEPYETPAGRFLLAIWRRSIS